MTFPVIHGFSYQQGTFIHVPKKPGGLKPELIDVDLVIGMYMYIKSFKCRIYHGCYKFCLFTFGFVISVLPSLVSELNWFWSIKFVVRECTNVNMTPWTDLNEYFITSVTNKSLWTRDNVVLWFTNWEKGWKTKGPKEKWKNNQIQKCNDEYFH